MSNSGGAKVAEWMVAETLAENLIPLLDRYDVKWRGHGLIYVDHEQYNIVAAQRIIVDLSVKVGVPSQLIRSRLVELGWLNDARAKHARDDVARVIGSLGLKAADMTEEDDSEGDEIYDYD